MQSKGQNLLTKIVVSRSMTSGERRRLREAFLADVDIGVVSKASLVEVFGLTTKQGRNTATAVDAIVSVLPPHTRAAWTAALRMTARRRVLQRVIARKVGTGLPRDVRDTVAAFLA